MAKSTRKRDLRKSRLSTWRSEWCRWLKSRAHQQALQFPFYPAISSIVTLILVAILYVLYSLHRISWEFFAKWSEELTILMFILAIIVFALSFVLVFILSFHPKIRKVADKYFGFSDRTELEELKEKVENGLRSTNEKIDKELAEINNRLASIEATLKTLTSKENKKGDET